MDTLHRINTATLYGADTRQQQRFYDLLADVLQSISLAERLEEAA